MVILTSSDAAGTATTAATKTKQVSIAEAKSHLPRLVHEAEEGTVVHLTRRGKPVAVMLGAEEYARLARGKRDFAEAYRAWRAKYGGEDLGIDPDEIWGDVRDRSPARDFAW